MGKLEHDIRTRLEDVLDQYFPKGESHGRGQALLLFAHAMVEIVQLIKAFGGCTKCYGKGYGTQTAFAHTSADLPGDVDYSEQLPVIVPCTCQRGKQIKVLLKLV